MTYLGFIGLGNMGAHMARNLLKSGHNLIVCDASPSVVKMLQKEGAKVAANPAEVAAQSETIITMLPSSPHVKEVYTGTHGIFSEIRPVTLCIDSSTIDPAVSKQMAALALEKQSHYVDAPVSGGTLAAESASLTFMVGGEDSSYARSEPYLRQMGKNIIRCGGSGTGQAAKICNNMLLAISMIGVSETMNLGQRLGLDAQMLAKIVNSSSGRCWSSDTYNPVPGVIPGVPSCKNYIGGFGASLMAKDLGLAQGAATDTLSPTPLGSMAHQIYRILSQMPEYRTKDFSVVYQFLKDQEKKK